MFINFTILVLLSNNKQKGFYIEYDILYIKIRLYY